MLRNYALFDFAYVANYSNKLKDLAELAQSENWNYRHTKSDHEYPILYNYLQYTFERLQSENKIVYSSDRDRACINTGLVTANFEPIYAYFVPNRYPRGESQPWFLAKFCQKSDRDLLVFGKLPELAHYFDNHCDLLYDPRLELRKNIDHIVDDNRERFPETLRENPALIQIVLEGAITRAIQRALRNYKTAVPQFHHNRIQLLLPLCLTGNKADLALVVDRENDAYLASTCLTLDMAYNNARLLARPDTEWLEP